MTRKLMLGTALFALMLSGPLAQAANNAPNPSTTPPAASATTPAQPEAGKPNFVMSQKPDQWLASNFKGTDVLDANNKKVGDVSDILFDKSGRIEAYVVSMGGFLGMGAKEVAIAPSSFTVVKGKPGSADQLKLSVSQKEIKQAQNFKPYEPPHPRTTTGSAPGAMGPHPSPMGGGAHHSGGL
jgi:sporulation protein YlmC with PRC-barrel domain